MYHFLQIIFTWLFSRVFHAEIIGTENMPESGGVILAANHMSNWDPPFLATFLSRPVAYMAKKELFEIPVFSSAIRSCHAFPVKRGAADRGALKAAVNELKDGKCVGLFPEGTRSKDGKVHKAESGISLIAAMTKVPVVPAAIIGTNEIFSSKCFFPKLKIIYGKPMYFEGTSKNKEELQIFSQKIMQEITKMKNNHSIE
ncbi:lysophospholipid acyltransferase family protein [Schwartzia sp. (in: firmicutes)]